MHPKTAKPSEPQNLAERTAIGRGIARWLFQMTIFALIFASSLFLSSGSLDWTMAWVYVGVLVANNIIAALVLIPRNPRLLAERARSEGPRDLDRVLAGTMALFGPLATLVVAGLDYRFAWSLSFALAFQIGAVAAAVLGALLTIWAMASNRHFYGVARINKEEGHAVAMSGPYRFVRHPGYAGAILFQLAMPLMLGSLWALIPAGLTVCAIVFRTALEDRMLQMELDGYNGYAQQVHNRLVPGIW
jgi:protein-S-isoprenylcysteine O-methyltransferase Ste14